MSRLSPGDKAPDIKLPDQSGKSFRLADSLKTRKSPHLVYFYPKADTPGCTTQACGLRDVADRIGDAVVVGISPDAPEKQAKFDTKYGLGFPLLSDADHAVAEAYGVWGERSLYGRKFMGIIRSAFLVDPKGKVVEAWYKISPADTPKKLLAALGAPK
ncbi:MAG TPA: thioredoxin-dependent thiol peroxidase [Acidimicrobiales bacterium]|nr:thioredoxin-dependent thiol peroxidase [Acidimicrobiales bacterium]